MDFVPASKKEEKEMLKTIGISSLNSLFKDVPKEFLLKKDLKIPKGLSELELSKKVSSIAAKNKIYETSFRGAGAYRHFIPSVVHHLTMRSEFYTAYTPYQAERSQGMLQSIYEFQTMICRLTGMDLANASMYDGASALAEAALMATRISDRKEILLSETVHPDYQKTVGTYCHANSVKINKLPSKNGIIELKDLKKLVTDKTGGVLIQNPNFFGSFEKIKEIAKIVHDKGAILVVSVIEPTSLALLKAPGKLGADIVVGDGQSFGIPVSFGGPYVGFMATKTKYIRRIPGRLVGMTEDTKGRRAFVLTLQAREQHIRREKATSNICTNSALCALAVLIYLATMGDKLKEVAKLSMSKAHYLAKNLNKVSEISLFNKKPFYNEFIIKVKNSKSVLSKLKKNNIEGGVDLGKYYPKFKDHLLFCATEINTREEMDKVIKILSRS
ncbi:MAG: aminomethyl-transferring glycine dehydrogenase subunit GcvPA [Patescibacteria group bacterium]|nr:aminomethyl-transferring glycine dehydrogenase subunit GcvPA [Patescibacteria group bacterium]